MGSDEETIPNRSPLGSQAKAVTVSARRKGNESVLRWVGQAGGECVLTLELDDLDGVVLLPHPEDLEVAEDRLLGLGVAVDLDTQEVSLVLPVKLALRRVIKAKSVIRLM